jgi:hypothetical protein
MTSALFLEARRLDCPVCTYVEALLGFACQLLLRSVILDNPVATYLRFSLLRDFEVAGSLRVTCGYVFRVITKST